MVDNKIPTNPPSAQATVVDKDDKDKVKDDKDESGKIVSGKTYDAYGNMTQVVTPLTAEGEVLEDVVPAGQVPSGIVPGIDGRTFYSEEGEIVQEVTGETAPESEAQNRHFLSFFEGSELAEFNKFLSSEIAKGRTDFNLKVQKMTEAEMDTAPAVPATGLSKLPKGPQKRKLPQGLKLIIDGESFTLKKEAESKEKKEEKK